MLKRLYWLKGIVRISQPPSGGCVLKLDYMMLIIMKTNSRLQAAVC